MLRRLGIVILIAVVVMMALRMSNARDLGQWENSDPRIKQWFESLMQPDNPTVSCCGEADGYWADQIEVKDGKVYAIITDDRPDEPLGRPHIPLGTRIEVPPHKYKYSAGNPTGHAIIFLSSGGTVYCFVQGTLS